MWQTVKGGRRGRPRHSRPIICSSPDVEALPPRTILRDEPNSNESTQDVGGASVQESMDVAQGGKGNINAGMPSIYNTVMHLLLQFI